MIHRGDRGARVGAWMCVRLLRGGVPQRRLEDRADSRAAGVLYNPRGMSPGDLLPGPRVLLGPGPAMADPRVLRALSTPLRLGSHWLARTATRLQLRNREVLFAHGGREMKLSIEREFERVTTLLENLEQALRAYDGAMIVVSHDATFLERIGVDQTLELESE